MPDLPVAWKIDVFWLRDVPPRRYAKLMSKIAYYEIHVTLEEDSNLGPEVWTSSNIDGDPDLGKGTRYYRTAHTASLREAMALVDRAKEEWPNALRYKIELVILDERKLKLKHG